MMYLGIYIKDGLIDKQVEDQVTEPCDCGRYFDKNDWLSYNYCPKCGCKIKTKTVTSKYLWKDHNINQHPILNRLRVIQTTGLGTLLVFPEPLYSHKNITFRGGTECVSEHDIEEMKIEISIKYLKEICYIKNELGVDTNFEVVSTKNIFMQTKDDTE